MRDDCRRNLPADGRTRLDIVDEIAYPLPFSVICVLLGVPAQDEARFHGWADTLARALDLDPNVAADELAAIDHAVSELRGYLD